MENKWESFDSEEFEEAIENSDAIQNERIDDVVDMIEDHCLAMALDEGLQHVTLTKAKAWSQLDEIHWEELLEQLSRMKIMGATVNVVERVNPKTQMDELFITWGYRS